MEKQIQNFQDLIVYQNLYQAMVIVLTKIIPKIPASERFDLANQMRRACKAAPALIAEGFAKRYQKLHWRRYLNDSLGESNEMIHHISVCLDIYGDAMDRSLCEEVRDLYEQTCKQLTRLGQVWKNYHETHLNQQLISKQPISILTNS